MESFKNYISLANFDFFCRNAKRYFSWFWKLFALKFLTKFRKNLENSEKVWWKCAVMIMIFAVFWKINNFFKKSHELNRTFWSKFLYLFNNKFAIFQQKFLVNLAKSFKKSNVWHFTRKKPQVAIHSCERLSHTWLLQIGKKTKLTSKESPVPSYLSSDQKLNMNGWQKCFYAFYLCFTSMQTLEFEKFCISIYINVYKQNGYMSTQTTDAYTSRFERI